MRLWQSPAQEARSSASTITLTRTVVMGRCALRPSPTHTGTRTIHTSGELAYVTHPGPTTLRASPHVDRPSLIQAVHSASCFLPSFSSKSNLGSGEPGVQETQGMCSRGHGCSSIGRCEQATKV